MEIDFLFIYALLLISLMVVSLFSIAALYFILLIKSDEIDSYFDSPDFSFRGTRVMWPYGFSKMLVYGVFLLFNKTGFVKKKFPHAYENINIDGLPAKIKLMVLFPMYTFFFPWAFIFSVGGVVHLCSLYVFM